MELEELIKNPAKLRKAIVAGTVDIDEVRRKVCFIKKHKPLDELIGDLIMKLNFIPDLPNKDDEVIRELESDAFGTDDDYKDYIHSKVFEHTKRKNKEIKRAINTNLIWYTLSERLGHYCLRNTHENNIKKIAAFCVYIVSRQVGVDVTQEDLCDSVGMTTSTITSYAKVVMKKLLGYKYHTFWDKYFSFLPEHNNYLDSLGVPYMLGEKEYYLKGKYTKILKVNPSKLNVEQLKKINEFKYDIYSHGSKGYNGFFKSELYNKLIGSLARDELLNKSPC